MKRRLMVPGAAALLSVACLTLMYFLRSPVAYILLGVCLLLLFAGYVIMEQRRAAEERKQLLESFQRMAAATLGHHRHDWMNDLQILYGYIQLGKYDKLKDCVERIKERMAADSKISRLGIPSLVFYLHSFREMNGSIQLEVQIQDDLTLGESLSSEDAEQLTEAIMETIRFYQFTGRSSWGELPKLKLELSRMGDEIIAVFEREGCTSDPNGLLKRHLEEWNYGKRVMVEVATPDPASLRLRVPCVNYNEVKSCS